MKLTRITWRSSLSLQTLPYDLTLKNYEHYIDKNISFVCRTFNECVGSSNINFQNTHSNS